MALAYFRRGRNRSAGEVYGFAGFGALDANAPAIGSSCTTGGGQAGTVQEVIDDDMGMVVGLICTTTGAPEHRYRTPSGGSGYSPTPGGPAPLPPAPPSPFAGGRVPGAACSVNGVMGVFNSNLECVVGASGPLTAPTPPASAPTTPAPGQIVPNAAPPIVEYAGSGGGDGLAMPAGGGGGGGGDDDGGLLSSPVTLLAAAAAAWFVMRKR